MDSDRVASGVRREFAWGGTCPVESSCRDVGNDRWAAYAKPGVCAARTVFKLSSRPIPECELVAVGGSGSQRTPGGRGLHLDSDVADTALIGIVALGDSRSALKLASIGLMLAGVVGLNLSGVAP